MQADVPTPSVPTDVPSRRRPRGVWIAAAIVVAAATAAVIATTASGDDDAEAKFRGFTASGVLVIGDDTRYGVAWGDPSALGKACGGTAALIDIDEGRRVSLSAMSTTDNPPVPLWAGDGRFGPGITTTEGCRIPFTVPDALGGFAEYRIQLDARTLGSMTAEQLRNGTATVTVR